MSKRILIFCVFISISFHSSFAQTLNPDSLMQRVEELGDFLLYKNHDSTYITNYSDLLTVKILSITKINFFKISDVDNDSNIRFRPDRRLNLGIGVSYKWFALDLAFNFGIGEDSDFKNSKTFDFQGSIFSSRQYISGSYNYYYGFQYDAFNGVPRSGVPEDKARDDIRTVSTVLQYLFAFNYDKFSLKAPFIQNELQRKSAGSFLIGARYQLFSVDGDSSMIPSSAQGYFDENAHLINLTGSSITLSLGYMYTLVFLERFYVTAGLIPGIGFTLGDFKSNNKKPLGTQLSTGWTTMNAVGYNTPRFFCGIQIIADNYRFRMEKDLKLNQGHGKIKFHFGYRFGGKRK